MIDLRQLRAVAVLAEELHFGRAAERLGMAQPHFSALIRNAERAVGVSLFQRRPRVVPTAGGEIVIAAAGRVFEDIGRSVEQARLVSRGETGTVRAGFASTVMLTAIPRLFDRFRRLHPGVKLELRELHSAPQWEELLRGTIDISLSREARSHPAVVSRTVLSERFVAVLPEGHPLSGVETLRLADLRPEPLVLFRRTAAPTLHHQILSFLSAGGLAANPIQEAEEWHTVLGFVAAGWGVSVAPESIRRLPWHGIVYRDIDDVDERADMFLTWMPDRVSPAAAKLVDLFGAPGALDIGGLTDPAAVQSILQGSGD